MGFHLRSLCSRPLCRLTCMHALAKVCKLPCAGCQCAADLALHCGQFCSRRCMQEFGCMQMVAQLCRRCALFSQAYSGYVVAHLLPCNVCLLGPPALAWCAGLLQHIAMRCCVLSDAGVLCECCFWCGGLFRGPSHASNTLALMCYCEVSQK